MTRDKVTRTDEEALARALEAGAYVDGAMEDDPLGREAFEERLAREPALEEQVDAYNRQKDQLHEAFAPLLHRPVPETLYRPLQAAGGRRAPSLRSIAAAAALVVAGAGAGWSSATFLQADPTAPAHAVLDVLRHDDMLAAILAASGGDGAAPLSAGTSGAVPTAQFEASGLIEIERSMKTVAGQPALIIDYRTPAGEAVTLMVQQRSASSANRPATLVQQDGVSASIWTGGTTVYTLISPTDGGPDISALTARIRSAYPPGSIPMPTPLLPEPKGPLGRDMPDDHMATGPGDMPLAPGLGQMPGDLIPRLPPVQAPQTVQAPEGQSL